MGVLDEMWGQVRSFFPTWATTQELLNVMKQSQGVPDIPNFVEVSVRHRFTYEISNAQMKEYLVNALTHEVTQQLLPIIEATGQFRITNDDSDPYMREYEVRALLMVMTKEEFRNAARLEHAANREELLHLREENSYLKEALKRAEGNRQPLMYNPPSGE